MSINLPANTSMLLRVQTWTVQRLRSSAGFSQRPSHSACSASLNRSPVGSSASSGPGAFHNYCTSDHIIHSPVVLKEQKCDEGREKEGNRKVLVQGSDG